MFNKCKHDWRKESEVLLKSPYEQTEGRLTKLKGTNSTFFRQTVVIILICTKCGTVRVIRESNP